MMKRSVTSNLWEALDLKLSEIFQLDFWFGLIGGVAALVLALVAPAALFNGVSVATVLIGVILGAVVAGVSIQVAFFDQSFLRKLRMINRSPVRYMAPFLFTAVIGVVAMVALLVLSVMSDSMTPWVLAPVAFIGGFSTIWAVTSLLPLLATLVQFIHLKMDALDVPDDVAELRPAAGRKGQASRDAQ